MNKYELKKLIHTEKIQWNIIAQSQNKNNKFVTEVLLDYLINITFLKLDMNTMRMLKYDSYYSSQKSIMTSFMKHKKPIKGLVFRSYPQEYKKNIFLKTRTTIATLITQLAERECVTNWYKFFYTHPPWKKGELVKAYKKYKEKDGWCWYVEANRGDGLKFGRELCLAVYSGHIKIKRKKGKHNRTARMFKIIRTRSKLRMPINKERRKQEEINLYGKEIKWIKTKRS